MTVRHTGNTQPSIDQEEHRSVNGVNAKAVIPYLLDGANATPAPIPFVTASYDYVSLAQNATQDIYSMKQGGSGGTLVATVTLTFTDSTKATLSTAVRT